jgi:glycosyltransferase involved in cell wall biosynthesis
VYFVIHKNKRGFTPYSFLKAIKFGQFLKKLKLDVWHFDSISPRLLGIFPFLIKQPTVLSLHDPKSHSGEKEWKYELVNRILFSFINCFLFYSNFAKNQFHQAYPWVQTPSRTIKLLPYTFVRHFKLTKTSVEPEEILFFGRLSLYKGIDLLVEAIPMILEKYPTQKFVIAGKPNNNFQIDTNILNKYKDNIRLIPEYLDISALVALIEKAAFIVCPYRDATQSGVLSTAFALGKCVVSTNVGSFPEYIAHGKNGWLVKAEAKSIASGIIEVIDQKKYLQFQENIEISASQAVQNEIGNEITRAYSSLPS